MITFHAVWVTLSFGASVISRQQSAINAFFRRLLSLKDPFLLISVFYFDGQLSIKILSGLIAVRTTFMVHYCTRLLLVSATTTRT